MPSLPDSPRGKVPRKLLLAHTQVELLRYQEKCRQLEERNETLEREKRLLTIQLEAARKRSASLEAAVKPHPKKTPLVTRTITVFTSTSS